MGMKELAIEKDAVYNMFSFLLDQKSATILENEVVPADAIKRIEAMEKFSRYCASSSMPAGAKRRAKNLCESFYDACCEHYPSETLKKYMEKNTDLDLQVPEDNSIDDKAVYSIDIAIYRMGFNTTLHARYIPKYFADIISVVLPEITTNYKSLIDCDNRLYIGNMLALLLSSYTKTVSKYDYPSLFFIHSFVNNLSKCSTITKDMLESRKELNSNIMNLLELVDIMMDKYGKKDTSL